MRVILKQARGHSVINVSDCHPAKFWKEWRKIEASWVTCGAVKYCSNPRRSMGTYIIIADEHDAIRLVYSALYRAEQLGQLG